MENLPPPPPLLVLGRLHKRAFQRDFRDRWSQAIQSWDESIHLGPWLLMSVQHWLNQSWLRQGGPYSVFPAVSGTVHGYLAPGVGRSFGFSGGLRVLESSVAAQAHQSVGASGGPPMSGEFPSFSSGQDSEVGNRQLYSCMLCKQTRGARSRPLSLMAEDLLLWCQANNILFARHIAGKLNIVANLLSRPHMVLNTEWTLSHKVLRRVWATFFKPMVDLFATRFSKRLPLYVSPVPDPQAWEIDALSIPWVGLEAYAFPPVPHHPQGSEEGKDRSAQSATDPPQVASAALVSRTTRTEPKSPSASVFNRRGSGTAAKRHPSRKRSKPRSSRLGVVWESLSSLGASPDTLDFVS